MNMPKANYLVALLSLMLVTFVLPNMSWARDDDDDKKREKHEQREKHGKGDDYGHREKHDDHKKHKHHKKGEARNHFIDDDHAVVRHYYGQNPHGLPPGYAKRHGKLARGQVVTTEYHTHLLPLPPKLELQLPPSPNEVLRRILGRDILMIDKRTNKVLDVLHDAVPR